MPWVYDFYIKRYGLRNISTTADNKCCDVFLDFCSKYKTDIIINNALQ